MKKKSLFLAIIFNVFVLQNVFSSDNIDLERIIVSASRMAQYDYKVASNVSVIRQEDIQASSARSVNEILEEQLGVQMYDSGTLKTSTIDIRGFGDTANRNVLILVNDRKINSIDISGPDLLQIPLESIERIEIIRGAGSVLYGDNAVGGVVNIITKEGKGKLSGQWGTSGGSYNTRGTDMQVSGETHDVSYYLFSKYYDYGGYRSNSDLLAKDYNGRLGYRVSDKVKMGLTTFWHEDSCGLPGGLTDTELEQLGRRGSGDEDDFASSKDRAVQLTFDVSPWPQDLDLGRLVTDFSYRNRDTYAMFASFGEYATKSAIDTYGLNSKYIFDKELFGKEFNIVTGVDFYNIENDILGSGLNSDDLTIAKDEFGVYGFSEYEMLDNLFINGGTRFQKAFYEFDQRSPASSVTDKDPETSVSMAGARYEYARGSNVFFNVQQTFRFLATDEWYDTFNGLNTNLKQQEGIQYEAGLKHNFSDTYILSLTPYVIDLKNEIFFDPAAGNFGFGANSNYDKTRRVGLEVGQELDVLKIWDTTLLSDLNVFTNYTYQEAKFDGGVNDDKTIPLTPQHQVNAGINLAIREKYRFSMSGHYVGSRFAINDTLNQTAPIKPYVVTDAKLSYEKDPLTLFLSLNNIFNQRYFSYVSKSPSSSTKNYFPAPERNFIAGMTLKF